MSVLRLDDRKRLDGDLGGVPILHDQVAVRIDEVIAIGAAQQRARIHDVRISEDVAGVELLSERAAAPRAVEALVEPFKFIRLTGEDVLVPFDGREYFGGIHLFEHSHETTVSMVG